MATRRKTSRFLGGDTSRLINTAAVSEDYQSDFAELWAAFIETDRFSLATKQSYNRIICRYLQWALKSHLVAVPASTEVWEAYSLYCMKNTRKLSTYNVWMMGPDRAHAYSGAPKPAVRIQHKWHKESRVRKGELAQPTPAKALTNEDFGTLMTLAKDGSYQQRMVVLTMLLDMETGCRISDAVQLKWSTATEYDDGGIAVMLPRSKNDQNNIGIRRDVSKELVGLLARLYQDFGIENPVYLLCQKADPRKAFAPSSLKSYIHNFKTEYGLEISSHSGRRGFVAAAVKYGLHPMEIASYLGCSVANIAGYARHLPSDQSPARTLAKFRRLEVGA